MRILFLSVTDSQKGDEIEEINMKLHNLTTIVEKGQQKLTKTVDEVMSIVKKVNIGVLLNMISDCKSILLGLQLCNCQLTSLPLLNFKRERYFLLQTQSVKWKHQNNKNMIE